MSTDLNALSAEARKLVAELATIMPPQMALARAAYLRARGGAGVGRRKWPRTVEPGRIKLPGDHRERLFRP